MLASTVLREVVLQGNQRAGGDLATIGTLYVTRAMGDGHFLLPDNLSSMRNLRRLGLYAIDGLPLRLSSALAHLTALRELIVVGANWTQLPAELQALNQLKRLEVREGFLQHLNTEIGALAALEHLNISGPFDTPNAFEGLAQFNSLNVLQVYSHHTIDLGAARELKLQQLIACSCEQIVGLHTLSSLRTLQRLSLSYLPATQTLDRLEQLGYLELCRNNAARIVDKFPDSALKSLRRVVIGDALVVDLAIFRNAPLLEHIELRSIQQVQNWSVLASLPSLRVLCLDSLDQVSLPVEMTHCPALKILQLWQCSLEHVLRFAAQAPALETVYANLNVTHDLLRRSLAECGVRLVDGSYGGNE